MPVTVNEYADTIKLGTDYEELEGSPVIWIDEKGFHGTRKFRVKWNQLASLYFQVVGTVNNNQDSSIAINLPQPLPQLPAAWCLKATSEPFHTDMTGVGSSSEAVYGDALLTCEYGIPPQGNPRDPHQILFSESMEGAVKYETVPVTGLWWSASSRVTGPPASCDPAITGMGPTEAPIYQRHTAVWTVTRHKALAPPQIAWNAAGCVNSKAIVSYAWGTRFGVETLLYTPGPMSLDWFIDGTRGYHIAYKFLYNQFGWNTFMKRGQTVDTDTKIALPQMVYDNNGNQWRCYQPIDFTPILQI